MRILFISRAFPPVTGGIENQNAALAEWLSHHSQVTLIANRLGKRFLPIFLPYATIKALWLTREYDVLLLGDGVLAIVGWAVKLVFGRTRTVVCVTHGLDLTYTMALYRFLWVRHFIPACDRIIAVGNETIRKGVLAGIPESKFIFIPNGVDTGRFSPRDIPRDELEKILKADIRDKRVLYTGGRLVKRKGVAWFIHHVLPSLPRNVVYVVSGDGPDRGAIETAVREAGVSDRVFLLGFVTDEEREVLLDTCDLFVQPNIPVEGDMEGFGLVVLEAASTGIPVLVSRLEGLRDAIHDGENGRLAEPGDPESFIRIILEILGLADARASIGSKARRYVIDHFDWNAISRRYADILETAHRDVTR